MSGSRTPSTGSSGTCPDVVEVTGDCDEDSQVFSLESSYVGAGTDLLYTLYVSAGYT